MYSHDLRYYLGRPWIGQGLAFIFLILIVFELWQFQKVFFGKMSDMFERVSIQNTSKESHHKTVKAHYFGLYLPSDSSDGSLPQSLLDIEVVGIMYAEKPTDSQVILKTSQGEERLYHVGEEVAQGVVIEKITPSGVLLIHEGNLEQLSLPKEQLTEAPVPGPLQEDTF